MNSAKPSRPSASSKFRTHIQSGNLVFKAPKQSPSSVSRKLEALILKKFGHAVSVITKSPTELGDAIQNNPFLKEKGIDLSRLHVTFLSGRPEAADIKKLEAIPSRDDRFHWQGDLLYPPPSERSGREQTGRCPLRKIAFRPSYHSQLEHRQQPLPDGYGSRMSATRRTRWTVLALLAAVWPLLSCSSKPDPNTLVMIIESSPTNLDPRVGLDAQSERIDELIFDDLLDRDEHLNVKPALADSWEIPDPKTYVFHLHHGVKFHDGRPLTARDVKWTFDSILQGKIRTTKSAVYRPVDHIDTPDDYTVVFHLKEPFATLLWNLSDGAIGIVPYGSGEEVSQHPIGSGPFRFVSAEQDKEVIIERNDDYWGEKAKLPRVRFAVVPDPTTRALEMRKGSADVLSNALGFDTVVALQRETSLVILRGPGTILSYMAFNLRDPILKDVRVRQAIAYAINRPPILKYLGRGFERPAYSVLPPESWAYDGNVPHYDYDPDESPRTARLRPATHW